MSKNSQLALVKKKSSIKKISKMKTVLDELRSEINELGDISSLVDDPDIIQHICELVENVTVMKLKGESKSELVIKLLLEIYPVLNNDKDKARIQKQINNFCGNKIIKAVPTSKIVGNTVCWLLKKSFGAE